MSDLLERLKLAATMFNDCEVSSFMHGEFNAGELLEQDAAKIEKLQGVPDLDPSIADLSVTEAICLDKLKKENAELREALLRKFEDMARPSAILLACGEMTAQERRTASAVAK